MANGNLGGALVGLLGVAIAAKVAGDIIKGTARTVVKPVKKMKVKKMTW